mmetsp:Transcript_41186/g.82432  ORF Transcript_41186/g.82432 Transcript_41186/m.82432 type:complete len:221 (-) Transcript_41186:1309-1971(-)
MSVGGLQPVRSLLPLARPRPCLPCWHPSLLLLRHLQLLCPSDGGGQVPSCALRGTRQAVPPGDFHCRHHEARAPLRHHLHGQGELVTTRVLNTCIHAYRGVATPRRTDQPPQPAAAAAPGGRERGGGSDAELQAACVAALHTELRAAGAERDHAGAGSARQAAACAGAVRMQRGGAGAGDDGAAAAEHHYVVQRGAGRLRAARSPDRTQPLPLLRTRDTR